MQRSDQKSNFLSLFQWEAIMYLSGILDSYHFEKSYVKGMICQQY
jgi:hypothetical protein